MIHNLLYEFAIRFDFEKSSAECRRLCTLK